MKSTSSLLKYTKNILICCIWCLTVCSIPLVFSSQSKPIFRQEVINDSLNKTTSPLYPGDSIRQVFELDADYLESVSLAFSYENSALDFGNMIIQFYHGENLIVEQPLILAACPQNTFLSFHLNLENCMENNLIIQITNVSENAAGIFSLLSTTNTYAYRSFSEGYLINNSKTEDGSILCSFNIRTGYNYYIGLTYAFLIFLAAIILTRLIVMGYAWLRQRKYH